MHCVFQAMDMVMIADFVAVVDVVAQKEMTDVLVVP